MGGECETHGKEEKYVKRFWWENLKEMDPLEKKKQQQRQDNIKLYIKEMGWKSDMWIYLAQNKYLLVADEPRGTIKREEFNLLRHYQLLTKKSFPWGSL